MHAFVNNRMTEVLLFLHRPRVRSIVQRVPIAGRLYAGYRRQHPFDREFGTDTGGFKAAGTEEAGEGGTEPSGLFYIGSQPSIVRTVLSLIPHPEQKHLIDIGKSSGIVNNSGHMNWHGVVRVGCGDCSGRCSGPNNNTDRGIVEGVRCNRNSSCIIDGDETRRLAAISVEHVRGNQYIAQANPRASSPDVDDRSCRLSTGELVACDVDFDKGAGEVRSGVRYPYRAGGEVFKAVC